tara:strand:+ start:53 stop:877 length:825 start_codon:yes stop_codon:yes gene_type:complete
MTTERNPLELLEQASADGDALISALGAVETTEDELVSPPSPVTTEAPAESQEDAAQWQLPTKGTPEVAIPAEQAELFRLPEDLREQPQADPQALNNQERERLQFLERERQQFEGLKQQQTQEGELSQLRSQYEKDGYDSQTIEDFISIHRTERQRLGQEREQFIAQVQEYQGKLIAAQQYGTEHGVDPQDLMATSNPEEMKRLAKMIARNAKLEQRILAVEKQKIPEQHYDGSTVSGGPLEGAALEQALANGAELTPERMEKLDAYYKSQGFRR